jgi:hypothetical protein
MFDIFSYIMGKKKGNEEGTQNVVISGSITATDDGDGNVVIKEAE